VVVFEKEGTMIPAEYKVKILFVEFVTHDVKSFIVERPQDYHFEPGQATTVSLQQGSGKNESGPFTFTSLEDDPVLQFMVKEYPEHQGMTKKLHALTPGDELTIRDAWSRIRYDGPGTFLAAGAGVTPFVAILRELRRKNQLRDHSLFLSNRRHRDIILEREFREMSAFALNQLFFTLSREQRAGYENGRIDRFFLSRHIEDFNQRFYLCGPPLFVASMKQILLELGAASESLVWE
jgi:ferredoxin-NADP reductase